MTDNLILSDLIVSGEAPLGMLIKTSLVDFPSHVSGVIFLHGCNLRCPYCYNVELITGSPTNPEYTTFQQLQNHLEKRKSVLSGLVISGGEALLHPYLPHIIKMAKQLGYKIKIDTNGTVPEKLEALLQDEELRPDFIALDIKTSPKNYYKLLGRKSLDEKSEMINPNILAEKIIKSVNLLKDFPSEKREFRTVLVPSLITKDDIIEIGQILPKDASWQFAVFRNENCLDPSYNKLSPYTDKEMQNLVELAKTFIPNSNLR